ncbi:hypothetical protein Q4508_05770 [Amphritea sp. 2_MG-2023]|jgi:hypothetical protein|uniref:hypothetical protein n=1 Tax=Amphritea TaxID=515417 RepID=UPI001C079056|nr:MULTISPECIES: hypothetical protein [Amphritea]MBU2965973.1 hypothetical protein [Amphritea atlantica]MDO6418063.1 hypothetical protein [Amphritea sp. 2_MG-2023]MDX2423805.1 hypothetical protein [Amphritea sp.]
MEKAKSAPDYAVRRHRLIEQHEIIHFQDQHCPVEILTEEAIEWITVSHDMISLEILDIKSH